MESQKKLYWTIGIILLIFVIAVGYLMFIAQIRNKQNAEPTTNQSAPGANQRLLPLPTSTPPIPEMDLVYTYTGSIRAIDKTAQSITMVTQYGVKTVTYGPKTIFVTKKEPSIEELQTLTSKELTERILIEEPLQGELKIGDRITAQSATNISGKPAFTAIKITLIQ